MTVLEAAWAANDLLRSENDCLRADIERLWSALEEIAALNPDFDSRAVYLARRALERKS